jgi:hypothetical protein
VIKVGRQLLTDFGNQLSGREKAAFMRALHALAWHQAVSAIGVRDVEARFAAKGARRAARQPSHVPRARRPH